MEMQFVPEKILDAIESKIWLILLTFIVSMALGIYLGDPGKPDQYIGETTLYSASRASFRESIEGVETMVTYAEVVQSRKVAAAAVDLLAKELDREITPEEIMSKISFTYTPESAVLRIRASDPDPRQAILIANAVGEAFAREITRINATDSVQILDAAEHAVRVSSGLMGAIRFCMVITFFGVFMVVGGIVIMALLDGRVGYPRELTLDGELEMVGSIPFHGETGKKRRRWDQRTGPGAGSDTPGPGKRRGKTQAVRKQPKHKGKGQAHVGHQ